jgi:hypothetical protein
MSFSIKKFEELLEQYPRVRGPDYIYRERRLEKSTEEKFQGKGMEEFWTMLHSVAVDRMGDEMGLKFYETFSNVSGVEGSDCHLSDLLRSLTFAVGPLLQTGEAEPRRM